MNVTHRLIDTATRLVRPLREWPRAEPIPHAGGLPIIEQTVDFLFEPKVFLTDLLQRVGPVARIKVGWVDFAVLLGDEARDFMKSGLEAEHLERMTFFGPVGQQLGNDEFVLGLEGETHERVRRCLAIAYSREIASSFVPRFVQSAREQLATHAPGAPIEVMPLAMKLGFLQYCYCVNGQAMPELFDDMKVVMDFNMNIGGRTWPMWMYKLPHYQAAKRHILEAAQGWVTQHQRRPSAPETPDIVDALLSVKHKDGGGLKEQEVHSYALYGFAGTMHYMSRAVAFLVYEILKDPVLYAGIEAEVDALFEDGDPTDAAVLRRLPVLRGAYLESLRFHPVSQGLPFRAKHDFEHKGCPFHKAQTVVLSHVPMHFDRKAWRDPERYDFTRALPPRNEMAKNTSFAPFGFGHRTCTAVGMVEVLVLTMVATLIREARLELDPPGYELRTMTMPLPAPVGRFGMRIAERRRHTTRSTAGAAAWEPIVTARFPEAERDEVEEALGKGQLTAFAAGAELIREGDKADAFYVLVSGEVDVVRWSSTLKTLHPGDYFGEAGLLADAPRNATVRARGAVQALVLDRALFLELIASSDLVADEIARLAKRRHFAALLSESIAKLEPAAVEAALSEFTSRTVGAGEVVFREGDAPDRFYLVRSGAVTVTRKDEGRDEVVATLGPGRYFGEIGLLTGLPRTATITAAADTELLGLDRPAFVKLLELSGGAKADVALTMAKRLAVLAEV